MIAKNTKNQKFDKKEKTKFKTIIFSVLIVLFFILMLVFLAYSNMKLFKKNNESKERANELKEEIIAIEEQNEKLKEGIADTENEDYREELIREQGYKKPGEQAIVVLPPKTEENIEKVEEKSFWQKFWDVITFWN